MMHSPDSVASPIKDHQTHQALLALPQTLMAGTMGMKAAGTKYLPKEDGESDGKYRARLGRSVLFNAFKRTVDKLCGEVFSGPITFDADATPDEIEKWAENIDLAGRNLDRFCLDVFRRALVDGVCHIFVDHPPNPKGASPVSQDEAQQAGLRPYWRLIRSGDLIGWKSEIRNGRRRLSQIRIREITQEPDGNWNTRPVERIRVVEPGNFRVFRKKQDDVPDADWFVESKGPFEVDEIPISTFAPGEPMSRMTARPPLLDLAELNRAHWQSASDQRNVLHYARMVVWFGKMLGIQSGEKVFMGANTLIQSNNPEADLKVVEHSGVAIESGRKDIRDLENAMALFGLTLMLPKAGSITATQRTLDSAENDSVLNGWVRLFQDVINTALIHTAAWAGLDTGGSVCVNRNFSSVLAGTEAKVLLQAFENGLLDRDTVLTEYKRRGIISPKIDPAAVAARIREQDISPEPGQHST